MAGTCKDLSVLPLSGRDEDIPLWRPIRGGKNGKILVFPLTGKNSNISHFFLSSLWVVGPIIQISAFLRPQRGRLQSSLPTGRDMYSLLPPPRRDLFSGLLSLRGVRTCLSLPGPGVEFFAFLLPGGRYRCFRLPPWGSMIQTFPVFPLSGGEFNHFPVFCLPSRGN